MKLTFRTVFLVVGSNPLGFLFVGVSSLVNPITLNAELTAESFRIIGLEEETKKHSYAMQMAKDIDPMSNVLSTQN